MDSSCRLNSPGAPTLRFVSTVLSLGVAAAVGCSSENGSDMTDPNGGPTTGTIRVSTATSGDQPDPDGYGLELDDTSAGTLGVDDVLVLEEVTPGGHDVRLTGVADNCTVNGSDLRTTNVVAGDTSNLTYNVDCPTPPPPPELDVVYVGDQNTPVGIWALALGQGREELLFAGSNVGDPNFSPDGSSVVFENGGDLWIMDGDGGNPRLLMADGASPSWSPDGSTIAFSRAGSPGIWTLVLAQANPTQITTSGRDPEWSPVGDRIAFFGQGTIDLVDPDGQNRVTIVPGTGGTGLAWSPDGSTLVLSRTDLGGTDLWVVDSDGQNLDRFTNSNAGQFVSTEPYFEPTGTRVLFTRVDNQTGDRALWLVDADGSNFVRVRSGIDAQWRDVSQP